ncbi:MAG: DUF456 domain-containing protein [Bacteroidaceae bacterium]|nr:DUF456 domain-containing protein [Bacteroidaceae bacterium]
MSIALIVFAVILGVVGIIGSIVPGLPGPPISWIGLLLAFFGRRIAESDNQITLTCLLIWLAITLIVTVLDYVIPSKFTRLAGGSKAGSWGAMIGLLIGIIFTYIGMIAGCFLGALIGELAFGKKEFGASCKSALGAFAGVMAGTGLKLITTVTMMFYIIF